MTYVPATQRDLFNTLVAMHAAQNPAGEADSRRVLSEFVSAIQAEQRETDLYSHYAYRPEVVAEVAVLLSEESDWKEIADWCGGHIHTSQDPSGEYTSSILLPNGDYATNGWWIALQHDGTFRARAVLEQPTRSSIIDIQIEAIRSIGSSDPDLAIANLVLEQNAIAHRAHMELSE